MTTSVVPACEAAVVSLVRAAITDDATFWRAWPGPDATRRMGFLTEVSWDLYEDAAVKSSPRNRREQFDLGFELWEFGTGDITSAADVSDSAMSQLAVLEGVLRVEAKLGVDGVSRAMVRPQRKEAVQFEKGWGFAVTGTIAVEAYLT